MVLLAGCGPVELIACTNIPPPMVVKISIGVALFVPTEFANYVHKEERWSTKWHVIWARLNRRHYAPDGRDVRARGRGG